MHEGIWEEMVRREEGEGAVEKVAGMMARSPGKPPWQRDNVVEEDGEGERRKLLAGVPRNLSAKDVARVMCQLHLWRRTWQPLFGSLASIPVSIIKSEPEDEVITR